jgi:catalase
VNHHQIPVNKPRCPVMNYIRDGALTTGSYGAAPNYWPNSHATAPKPDASFADPAWKLGEIIVDRYDSTVDHDDYTQPGNLYRMFDDAHRDRLTSRIAGGLGQARKDVQMRMLCHFFRVDMDYGTRIATKLGIDVNAMMTEMKNAGHLQHA